jgi:hypothetical protein
LCALDTEIGEVNLGQLRRSKAADAEVDPSAERIADIAPVGDVQDRAIAPCHGTTVGKGDGGSPQIDHGIGTEGQAPGGFLDSDVSRCPAQRAAGQVQIRRQAKLLSSDQTQ